MGTVREIPRTAAFAWSPDVTTLSIVTGTRAGAVDADFSSDTKLELWDLGVDNHEGNEVTKPICSLATDSRYDRSFHLKLDQAGNLYEHQLTA